MRDSLWRDWMGGRRSMNDSVTLQYGRYVKVALWLTGKERLWYNNPKGHLNEKW